jgi:hypothetical protein
MVFCRARRFVRSSAVTFAPSADVAKGGDGAKSALREIFCSGADGYVLGLRAMVGLIGVES